MAATMSSEVAANVSAKSGSVEDGQGDTAVPSMALPTGAPPVGKEERRGGDGAEDISVVAPAVETQCETVGATTTDRSPSVSVERETSLASGESKAQSVAETVPKVKDSSRSRRKEDKSIEHILKALNSLQTSEEKLAALCKKYTELLDEHRLLQNKAKKNERQLTMVMREKDQLQSEHSKAILAKSKLESLCRELQRHNKLVKEESLARAKEEDEKRKEVTGRFQTTITEIQQQMNDHYTKNAKLREENLELANKLKNLIEQYELREQHIEKMFKHRDLEQQLMDAKLAQSDMQVSEEKKRSIAEKELLMIEAMEGQKRIQLLEAQEKQLRAQVSLYTDKYEEFQSTLTKSNDVFHSFKTEMDKMTKKIKKLEKETAVWRSRWENSNKSLIDMAEEKTKSDREMTLQQVRIKKLESLCRALQEERKKSPAPRSQQSNGLSDDAPKENDVAKGDDASGPSQEQPSETPLTPEQAPTPQDEANEESAPTKATSAPTESVDVAKNASLPEQLLPDQAVATSDDPNSEEMGKLGNGDGVISEAPGGQTGNTAEAESGSGDPSSPLDETTAKIT